MYILKYINYRCKVYRASGYKKIFVKNNINKCLYKLNTGCLNAQSLGAETNVQSVIGIMEEALETGSAAG